MSRCEKTATCLNECLNMKSKNSLSSPNYAAGHVSQLGLFIWNSDAKRVPLKLPRRYGDVIEKRNSALIIYSGHVEQKRARVVTHFVSLTVLQFRIEFLIYSRLETSR